MNMIITNVILFQVGWLTCVMSGATTQAWIGSIIVLALIGIHILLIQNRQGEVLLILSAMGIGAVWDSFLVWQQWLDFPYGKFTESTAPYWIIMLWGLFATTLNTSLVWLKQKLALASVFGALAGPLAYLAGQNLGAVTFVDSTMAIISLSIGWAIFTPLLLSLSTYFSNDRKQMLRCA